MYNFKKFARIKKGMSLKIKFDTKIVDSILDKQRNM